MALLRLASIFVLALLQTGAAKIPTYVCEGVQRFGCDDTNGCLASSLPITTWVEFDYSGNTYSRCDQAGCDVYTPVVSSSGEFLNIELPGRTAFAKIGPDGSFTEVVSLGTLVMVTYGRCRAAPDL